MQNKKDFSSWNNEFIEFAEAKSASIPEHITKKILGKIQSDLNPGAFTVFTKMAFIHSAVGAATLLACPQFGISFTNGHGLMHYLMQYGDGVCMLGCGAFFTAFSLLIASLILKPEEVRAFKGNQILQMTSLSTYSLVIFLFLGGEVVLTLGLIWILGAILGGALSFEAGWSYRQCVMRKGLA